MSLKINKVGQRSADVSIEQSTTDSHLIKLIWSTGARGLRNSPQGQFYEELEMTPEAVDLTRLNSGKAPFLTEHEQHTTVQLGVVKRAWLEDGYGFAEIRLSKNRNQDIVQDVLDGILGSISVGYQIDEPVVTGEQDGIPVVTVKRWTPMELSLVSVPFDSQAMVLRSSNKHQEEIEVINPQQIQERQMTDEEIEKLKAEAVAEYKAQQEAEAKAKEDEEKAKLEEEEKLKAEAKAKEDEERKSSIALQIRAAGFTDDAETLTQDFITRSLTTEQISKELTHLISNKSVRNEQKDNQMTKEQLLEQALLNRVNAGRFPVERTNQYRSASFMDIAKALVEKTSTESEIQFAQRAIGTTDLQNLLSNVANKIVNPAPSEVYAYPRITRQQGLRDFKPTPCIAFSSAPLAVKGSETGDYTDATMTDSSESIQLADLGKLYKFSYVALINDDLQVFQNLDEEAEKAGQRATEKQLFDMLNANAALSDGKALFHTDHGNVLSASAAPSTTTLNSVELLMAAFTDGSSNPLDLHIKTLIVPPSQRMAAMQVANQIMAAQSSNVNPWAGQIDVICSSRITQVGGKDAWFAIAQDSPLVHGVMQGQGDKVEVEMQHDFNSKNLVLRVTKPSAIKAASYKGIVRVVLA